MKENPYHPPQAEGTRNDAVTRPTTSRKRRLFRFIYIFVCAAFLSLFGFRYALLFLMAAAIALSVSLTQSWRIWDTKGAALMFGILLSAVHSLAIVSIGFALHCQFIGIFVCAVWGLFILWVRNMNILHRNTLLARGIWLRDNRYYDRALMCA